MAGVVSDAATVKSVGAKTIRPWLCPQCGCRGDLVVIRTPEREWTCRKGHRWTEKRSLAPQTYVPLGVRLKKAQGAVKAVKAALAHAEVVILDCASYLTPEQKAKLALDHELHQLRQIVNHDYT